MSYPICDKGTTNIIEYIIILIESFHLVKWLYVCTSRLNSCGKSDTTLQIQSSIPKNCIKTLKQNRYSIPISNIQNRILINKSKWEIVEVKCKYYYWHLINNIMHMPKAITACCDGRISIQISNLKRASFGKQFLKCPSHVADTHQYKHSNIKLYTEH